MAGGQDPRARRDLRGGRGQVPAAEDPHGDWPRASQGGAGAQGDTAGRVSRHNHTVSPGKGEFLTSGHVHAAPAPSLLLAQHLTLLLLQDAVKQMPLGNEVANTIVSMVSECGAVLFWPRPPPPPGTRGARSGGSRGGDGDGLLGASLAPRLQAWNHRGAPEYCPQPGCSLQAR